MNRCHRTLWPAALALVSSAVAVPYPFPFTYQGQLKEGGVPASGEYDMRFTLFEAAAGGVASAGPLDFDGGAGNGVPILVMDGLFSVELLFGDVFDGTAFWLEIEVRPHGVGNYTTLMPRQPITAAPVALYALNGPGGAGPWSVAGGDIHNTNAGNVGIGTTTPAAPLHVAGDIRSDGPFGLAAYNPNNPSAVVALGWLNDFARIRIGGDGPGATGGLEIQKTGDRSLMRVDHDGNAWLRGGIDVSGNAWFQGEAVGIGTTDPSAKLDVVGGEGNEPAIQGSGHWGVYGAARDADGYGGVFASSEGVFGTGRALLVGGDAEIVDSLLVGNAVAPAAAKLHVVNGTESAPSGGGFLVLGNTTGANISVDNNEIMARNNGAVAPLYLNPNGGDVIIGGVIDIGYEVVHTLYPTSPSVIVSQCPAGKKVIAGGCNCGDEQVEASYPTNGNTAWYCRCDLGGNGYAICAKVK